MAASASSCGSTSLDQAGAGGGDAGLQAEVVGLHPMTAPPKSPTLKGRVMVVCEARVARWQPWVNALYAALEAERVPATPEHHDRVTALVQGMVHATHLAQAGVLGDYAPLLGELQALMPFRSASFELDTAVIARILSLNSLDLRRHPVRQSLRARNARPAVGAAGQRCASWCGRETRPRARAVARSSRWPTAKRWRRPAWRRATTAAERMGYLLADLTEPLAISVYLPEDRPGSLRALLHVFERHGLNPASIHSSRTPKGERRPRLGLEADSVPAQLAAATREIDDSGIGRVLPMQGERYACGNSHPQAMWMTVARCRG